MQADTMTAPGRIRSRRKYDVAGRTKEGRRVLAAAILVMDNPMGAPWNPLYGCTLIVEGLDPITDNGFFNEAAAYERLDQLLDRNVPDFLSGPPEPPPPPVTAKVVDTSTGVYGHHYGFTYYTITGTEAEIEEAVRQLTDRWKEWGIEFGELETIDGVLTARGQRRNRCF